MAGLTALMVSCAGISSQAQEIKTPAEYIQDARSNTAWIGRSVAYKGNTAALAAILKKSGQGAPVTIGFIGGSITQGDGASDAAKTSYAAQVYRWWKERFPSSAVHFVNAGVGGTSSVYGAHRIDADLLVAHPDVVVVEFSVNDVGIPLAVEGYEGLIRKIWEQNPHAAILALATTWKDGSNWQEQHLTVCRHYGIPMISYRDVIWPDVDKGTILWKDIVADIVHPNDRGHAYIAGLVIDFLDKVSTTSTDAPANALPAPLTRNRFQHSRIIQAAQLKPLSAGSWERTDKGWYTAEKGQPLVLQLHGKIVHLMYKRTNDNTGAYMYSLTNGKDTTRFDADFIGGWGTYPELKPVIYEAKKKKNKLAIYFEGDDPKKGGGSSKRDFLLFRVLEADY